MNGAISNQRKSGTEIEVATVMITRVRMDLFLTFFMHVCIAYILNMYCVYCMYVLCIYCIVYIVCMEQSEDPSRTETSVGSREKNCVSSRVKTFMIS